MKALVQDYYAAFNAGDHDAMLAMLTDDVVHEVNESPTETGKDAFHAFLVRMDRSYREQVGELMIFSSENPDRAAAEFFINGVYLATDSGLPEASGQTYRLRVGAFFERRDGKISRVTNHYNLQTWLRLIAA